jgi:spore maturation protein CgeB
MKILLSIPGHLNTVPMSRYVYETLKSMGHNVRLFDFGAHGLCQSLLKKISREGFLSHIDKVLIEAAKGFRPDIFLTIFGFDHRKIVIERMKSMGIITICWWLNDPFQFKRSVDRASVYDYYFINSKGNINAYRDAGVKNIFFLPVGCYPSVHKKLDNAEIKYDICFAGDWHPVREDILNSLARDFNIAIFGPWKKRKMNKNSVLVKNVVRQTIFSPEEMVRIFNQFRIVLNIHSWFGKWDYGINPRVFEANGCGSFQICDYKDEIPELYEPEKEIVLYKSMEELKEKLSFFLAHEKERNEIAENGFLKTINHHTYEHRLKEMFHITGLGK